LEFKIQVSANEEFYIIFLGKVLWYYADEIIAEELHITKHQYQKILKKHGAHTVKYSDCYFKLPEQAAYAIEELESILILNKLVGE